ALAERRMLDLRLCAIAERSSEPLGDRSAEALLRAVDDLARKKRARDRALEYVLADAAADLHPWRQRESELDELVVEERNARLDRCRHRHLVHAHQEELGETQL